MGCPQACTTFLSQQNKHCAAERKPQQFSHLLKVIDRLIEISNVMTSKATPSLK